MKSVHWPTPGDLEQGDQAIPRGSFKCMTDQQNLMKSLAGWRPSLFGWRPSQLGGRPSLLGGRRPSTYGRMVTSWKEHLMDPSHPMTAMPMASFGPWEPGPRSKSWAAAFRGESYRAGHQKRTLSVSCCDVHVGVVLFDWKIVETCPRKRYL